MIIIRFLSSKLERFLKDHVTLKTLEE